MITSILIAPSAGWADETGAWRAGASAGHMVEAELTRAVTVELGEALDKARLRWQALPVDRHPGLTPGERLLRIEPGMLVLHIAFPSVGGRGAHGILRSPYTGGDAALVEIMGEALSLWGRPFCDGYKVGDVRRGPLITAGHAEIVIEPFALDQDVAPILAPRMRALGESLSWGVEEYLRGRQHGASLGRIYGGRNAWG